MSARSVKLLAWGSLFIVVAGSVVATVFTVLAWAAPEPLNDFGPRGFAAALGLAFGTVGAIVASRRPSNPIGWIFCGAGVLSVIQAVGTSYALWSLVDQAGRPPGGTWAAWLEEWTWIPVVGSLGVVAAIFPDGRFLSRRWRNVLVAAMFGAGISAVLSGIVPELTIYAGYPNPVGVQIKGLTDIASASVGLFMVLMVAGAAAAIVRFRRSQGEEREQLKWLALSVSFVAVSLAIFGVASFSQPLNNQASLDWAENLVVAGILTVPVAIGIGVLKYRLYDIDIVINKAVVYGALAVFITLVYVAIVVGVGAAIGSRGNAVLSALAAAVVALAFQPARRRAQHLANRVVYGKRATPYEVLSQLSSRFAGTYSLEDALPRLARVTAEAVGAERIWIWLRSEGELRPAVSWPDADPGDPVHLEADVPVFSGGEAGFPVRHQGELLGAISVLMPSDEPLTATQEKLLTDVASQAGLVLRNVALVQDLRSSRRRIVAAQDDRAKALERNIHDGAQQQLVALSVKLRLAEQVLEADPVRARELIGQIQAETTDALENLRDLARGIYPPLLADKGLGAALEAQARKSPVPVTVEQEGIGRYRQEIESAVYFSALEAMQNVTKYAGATSTRISLAQSNGELVFEIADDGVGFDKASTPRGAGLTNIRDRLAAIDGSLDLRTAPNEGTVVSGRIPLREVTA